jgi:hypothetical protein
VRHDDHRRERRHAAAAAKAKAARRALLVVVLVASLAARVRHFWGGCRLRGSGAGGCVRRSRDVFSVSRPPRRRGRDCGCEAEAAGRREEGAGWCFAVAVGNRDSRHSRCQRKLWRLLWPTQQRTAGAPGRARRHARSRGAKRVSATHPFGRGARSTHSVTPGTSGRTASDAWVDKTAARIERAAAQRTGRAVQGDMTAGVSRGCRQVVGAQRGPMRQGSAWSA